MRIIRELITFRPTSNGTNINTALKYFTNVIKKRCTAFVLSDFYDDGYDDALKIASSKHDLVAIRIADEKERRLPNLGLVKFYDPESSSTVWVDTSSDEVRTSFGKRYKEHENKVESVLRKYGVDYTELLTGEDFVKPLLKLFKLRS